VFFFGVVEQREASCLVWMNHKQKLHFKSSPDIVQLHRDMRVPTRTWSSGQFQTIPSVMTLTPGDQTKSSLKQKSQTANSEHIQSSAWTTSTYYFGPVTPEYSLTET